MPKEKPYVIQGPVTITSSAVSQEGGVIEFRKHGGRRWRPVEGGTLLKRGDQLRVTGASGACMAILSISEAE